MTRARIFSILCFTAAAAAGAEWPTRFGLTYTDNVLGCASALTGKMAVTDSADMQGRHGVTLVSCATVRDLKALVEKIDGRYAFSVRADFVVIARSESPLLQRPSEKMEIKPFLVTQDFGQVQSLALGPAERASIRAGVQKDVRTPPLIGRSLSMYVGRYYLGPGVERIVGLLSGDDRGIRVFVGRLHDGRFDLLWDSPLVDARTGLELRDLDNDGVAELLFSSSVGPRERAVTILSVGGTSMLSEQICDHVLAMACALVVAESSYFSRRPDGTLDLVAYPGPEDGRVYRLKGGCYVRMPLGTPIPPETER